MLNLSKRWKQPGSNVLQAELEERASGSLMPTVSTRMSTASQTSQWVVEKMCETLVFQGQCDRCVLWSSDRRRMPVDLPVPRVKHDCMKRHSFCCALKGQGGIMLITYFYHLVRIFFHSDQVEMIFTGTVSCSPGSTTWRRHFHPPAFSTTGISCRTKKTKCKANVDPRCLTAGESRHSITGPPSCTCRCQS